MTGSPGSTVLESLAAAVRAAAAFDKNDQAPPSAILWTDEDQAWLDVLPKLRACMPELLTLGAYDAATKTGPAIWLKAMLGRGDDDRRLLPQADWPQDATPVIYLPGVARQSLRAMEECPGRLKPLCELQFRGVLWTQLSGKDWTPRAFLQSTDGGLGLSLAGDAATLGAMRQALEKLADVPVARLQGRTLDASDFHDLLAPDPSRTVLEWLSDPAAFKTQAGSSWAAFRTVCKDRFGFDPEKADMTKAGDLLARHDAAWAGVWSRFEENPRLYPGIREVLRRSKPPGADSLFGTTTSIYPQDNDAAETELRGELTALERLNEGDARARILELEQRHGSRRQLVWAKVDEAPLAQALWHLCELARLSSTSLGGADRDQVATNYFTGGWRVDDAALNVLAAAKSAGDMKAVGLAVRAVYRPWLEKAAENLQKLVAAKPLPLADDASAITAEARVCIVFADGLRMDLGQRLAAELAKQGLSVAIDWRWSTVPTVTATAKPAASPVASQLDPASESDDFVPRTRSTSKTLTADRFRALLKETGVVPLASIERAPDGDSAGWVELGTIDRRGHSEGSRLGSLVPEEVRLLVERIAGLLEAGWAKVRVVTDHGWLLLPGGLPKVTLPRFLTETNWRRCASIKAGATPEGQQHPWHWNSSVSIALAPGISCFREGAEYAHGGLSVQEAVVPVITVTRSGSASSRGADATIASLVWNQLTGRVQVAGTGGVAVDLRRDAADAASTLLDSDKPRPIAANGQVKIYAKDEADGVDAELVVLDPAGNVIARRRTRVGME